VGFSLARNSRGYPVHLYVVLQNLTCRHSTFKLGSRLARTKCSLASARLAVLEAVGFSKSLMSGGRTRGVKPHRMAKAYPELQAILQWNIKLLT